LQGHRSYVLPLPESLAMLQAACMEFLPGPMMSRDNVRSMRRDSVTDGVPMPFGLTPTALETAAPLWLRYDRGWRGLYDDFRQRAHHVSQ
jgi:NADH dehydrogenase